MVENRTCSFCGEAIEPGTGKMYIKKDGTVFTFCSNKCKKNNIKLRRVNRQTRWTTRYAELKNKGLAKEPEEKQPEEKPEPKKPAAKPKKAPAKKPAEKKAPAEKPVPKKEKPAEKSE
jgi:large subunit ribosomal protein L24e